MIEINQLCFRYPQNEQWILDNLNLTIKPGEFVAVLGQNGSGKSTLARQLNAILLPDKGSVVIDGMDTADKEKLWDIRQHVGMIFQNPDNQMVATVVEEDIAFGLENLGVNSREIRKRVKEALAYVGMDRFSRKEPHLLSGGQKQKVAIAGVLAMRPRYLIMDEPTAMLDPVGRQEVMSTAMRLNREEGLTVVNITHFMEEAVLADKVLVMEQGRIVMQGSPYEVFNHGEILRQVGLDLPRMAELKLELVKRGLYLPSEILTLEEMVDAICDLD